MRPVRLGPFLLERPLAQGGMAEVWRGMHEGEQVPVAVKVLTGAHARDDAFVRALNNEIHAVARLGHPGIIVLYDRGTVTDDAASASNGRLVAGSPWLAMEMCSHGALSQHLFPLPWSTSRALLLSLLDALAHAHARGVIHRDLKPGNILLCAHDDPRPGLKLSDFGIAQPLGLVDDDAGAGRAHAWSGTPRSMAPEQFNGLAHELGPWTDLYALGCLAFQLARGRAPFAGNALRLAVAHCHDVVPTLSDVVGYPAGYEGWVLRLLEKRPQDRFRTAADAAWALLRLTPDDDVVHLDWQGALQGLRPRIDDRDPSAGSGVMSADETQARTVGPIRIERGLVEPTPAPVVGDDSTGPMQAPVWRGHEAGVTQGPTALLRRIEGVVDGPPPVAVVARAVPPPVDDNEAEARAAVVIDDDDPFAAVLGVDEPRRPAEPATDPRSLVQQAPWTELLALANERRAAGIDDDRVTIAGPTALASTTTTPRLDDDARLRAAADPPPVPATWRRPDEHDATIGPARLRLLGAGLGLWGLRRVPFVDRLGERDHLWAVLTSSAANHCAVIVRGAAGVGRSRLLGWFGERAAEVGAATTIRARSSDDGGRIDGLAGGLARALRLPVQRGERADDDAVATTLRAALPALDDEEASELARFFLGAAVADERELLRRDEVIVRALTQLSPGRRAVLLLDDAHLGLDGIAFVHRLLQRPTTATDAIVVLLAVADEALAERPAAVDALEALTALPAVRELRLPPLPARDHRRLVEELLGLEPGLADAVATRSAGNPRFAVELVGDFVERGVLELMPTGFALRRGEVATLPDTLHAAWSTRLLRVLSTLPPVSRICLELGAVLGGDGDAAWIAVCERAGVAEASDVVARLIAALEQARFVVVDKPGAVRFSHAMLRESMTRLAHDAGRLAGHHRVIAASLAGRADLADRKRRAHHLLAAGDVDDALPVLFGAAAAALGAEGCAAAAVVVDAAFQVLDHVDAADTDPRRRRAIGLRARVLADHGRYDESLMWAGLVDDDAPLAARLDARRARALVAQRRGDLETAADHFQAVLVLAGDDDDAVDDDDGRDDAIDDALMGLADGRYYSGRLDDAAVLFGRALLRAQRRDDDDAVARCLWNLAYVALWRGDPAGARALLLRAQKVARAAALRLIVALGRNALGDVERIAGLPSEARHHYDEAARQLVRLGSGKARVVEVNLALCDVADGRVDDAVARAATLLGVVDTSGERVLSSLCHGVLALGAARAADWSAADAHLAAFLQPWSAGLVDGEHALVAEAFARTALLAGESWRAGVASGAARDIWLTLGREDRVETVPSSTT